MKTFFIQTLGCKVNHYESDQIAALLLSRGLMPADAASADLRVINTCSVTTQAASQSRQSVRRMVRLPVLGVRTVHWPTEPDQYDPTVYAWMMPAPAVFTVVAISGIEGIGEPAPPVRSA